MKNKLQLGLILSVVLFAGLVQAQSLFEKVTAKNAVFNVLQDDLGMKGLANAGAKIFQLAIPGGKLHLQSNGNLHAKNKNGKIKYYVEWDYSAGELAFTQYTGKNKEEVTIEMQTELDESKQAWKNIQSKVPAAIRDTINGANLMEVYAYQSCSGKQCKYVGQNAVWILSQKGNDTYFSVFWINPKSNKLRVSHAVN